MLIDFFFTLRRHQVPVTIRELLDLVEGLKHRLVYSDVDEFYQVARAIMVKDEKHYDKFDQAFGVYFKGLEDLQGLLESLIPDEFLRREFERSLTAEELEKIESMGGLEKLIEEFRKAKEAAEKGGEGEGEGEEPGEGGKGEQEGQGGQGPNGSGVGAERARKRRARKPGIAAPTKTSMIP